MDQKFCRDCKYFIYGEYCGFMTTKNPVTGKDRYRDAFLERSNVDIGCGPDAKNFEPALPPEPPGANGPGMKELALLVVLIAAVVLLVVIR